MDNDRLVPTHWCNILCDFPELYQASMFDPAKKNKTSVPLGNRLPKQPLSLLKQSHNLNDDSILIPEEIRRNYQVYRPTPFKRAHNLERSLDCKTEIYYKYEGANIAGSHKLNTAIAQVYYYKNAGIQHIVTGTGAGQWGTAIAYACKLFGLKCTVFMVKVSLQQKPMRKTLMELYGATVYESPSQETSLGQRIRKEDPNSHGSLAIATGEAIELISKTENAQFAVGSGENSVLLHQTVIGNEVLNQMDELNIFPDKVYACVGAGSNFCGISFPLLRYAQYHKKTCDFIAVEPVACPKLTRGIYALDVNDFSGMTTFSKMYTLGSSYMAPPIHAGGLRYHGTSEFLSALYDKDMIKACAVSEKASLAAGILFAENEGILPAPESAYAIAAAIADINKNKNLNSKIVINISGHGLFDLNSYELYKNNMLSNDIPDEHNIESSIEVLKKLNAKQTKDVLTRASV